MDDTVLLGRQRNLVSVPLDMWKQHLADVPAHMQQRLAFMTEAHHQVRYDVVRELPRAGQPIPPERIAERLKLPLDQVQSILTDLEIKLFFLVRNPQGAVVWAYPVTVEPTPHQLVFSTGEIVYAA